MITKGGEIVLAERSRQINEKEYTPNNDLRHNTDQLALAALCYVTPWRKRLGSWYKLGSTTPFQWPWHARFWRPGHQIGSFPGYWEKEDLDARIRELAKGGALVIAEIDRLLLVKETKYDH